MRPSARDSFLVVVDLPRPQVVDLQSLIDDNDIVIMDFSRVSCVMSNE